MPAGKNPSKPHELDALLAECRRLREQSRRIQDKARALAEKVDALKKRSLKATARG